MNTNDQQADDFFSQDAGETFDNDAYGKSEVDEQERKPAERHEPTEQETDHGSKPPTVDGESGDEDEEQEFYWDGKPLVSPTSEDNETDNDTPLVKQLRQTIKEQRKELREKNIVAPTPATAAPAPAQMRPAPKMDDDGIDYDPETYQQELQKWYAEKAQFEATQQQQQAEHDRLMQTFNERKEAYKGRIGKLKVNGYEDAEAYVAGELSSGVQTALIMHAEKPELVVLALARNPDLLKQAKEVTDPVQLGVLIGTIQARAKAMPKAKQQVDGAPSTPRGNGGSSLRDLDTETAKAQQTGDYTRVFQLKKQRANAAAKK